MFERFTESARNVVKVAEGAARALNHNYVGTEHLLIALGKLPESLAARVLLNVGVEPEWVEARVAQLIGKGDEESGGLVPFTPRTKRALELSLREALSLGHNYVGTEHILLGLVRENEGVAARLLIEAGADAERVRNEVTSMLRGSKRVVDHLVRVQEWTKQAALLVCAITKMGFSSSITVYHAPEVDNRHSDKHARVRVNVLWETLEREQMDKLIEVAERHHFNAEFSKQYGLTFRPKQGLAAAIIEAGEPS